jgi:hypothetical protein
VHVQIVMALRTRFIEYQEKAAPLAMWRALQLDILEAARNCPSPSRESIWTILGDGFWFERDPNRLASLIEMALAELERHHATGSS